MGSFMSIRKFNVEITRKDPFILSNEDLKHTDELTWDWNFEKNAYNTKKATIREYSKLITTLVKNRDTAEYVAKVCMIEIPMMNTKIDPFKISFFQSLFTRMVKTSKVIQDLSVQGSYIEAKALLRTNFERAVLIEYFSKNIGKISEYLKAKKSGNRQVLKNYSIKNIVNEIKRDYEEYTYLCHFAHPNLYSEDFNFFDFEGKPVGLIQVYNDFEEEDFTKIYYWNNNLLIESFLSIMNYLKENLPKEKIDVPLKRILDMIKKIKFVKPSSKEMKNTSDETPI